MSRGYRHDDGLLGLWDVSAARFFQIMRILNIA
jgi:hypothetical protein